MHALDRRQRDLARLADEPWDLVVVGGGIVGAGILLDAVSRGLRAALVEQEDLAVGTSSRSSRLIHGGLRYLQHLKIGLIREALAERSRLLRLAPHLVRLEPILFPVYGRPLVHRAFYGSGLVMYDLLGAARDGGRARHLGAADALAIAPFLRRDRLQGGIVYHDAVEDDARYVVTVVRTAIARGAVAVTRLRATGLVTATDGRATGLTVHDRLADERFDIRATRVVDATGVWGAAADAPLAAAPAPMIPSRGSHILVRRERIPTAMALTLRAFGRTVFLVSWPGHWIIGTTDAEDVGPPDHPAPSAEEVQRLLDTVNATLDVGLVPADIVGAYAGLRPLIGEASGGSTVGVSREHRVWTEPSGLVRIGGGKYTTYRVMAADAVDAALGDEAAIRPSATADLAMIGATDRAELDRLAAGLSAAAGLTVEQADQLVRRHGTEASAVTELGRELDLAGTLGPDVDQLEAEVAWAVREELALTLDDILARRTRLATTLPDRGAAIASRVAEIAGHELGWDAERQQAEIAAYLASAHREYDSPLPA